MVKHMESWVECLDQNGDGPSRMGSSTNTQCNECLKVFDKIHLTCVFFKVWVMIWPHKSCLTHLWALFINPAKKSECMHKYETMCKMNHKDHPGIWEVLNIRVWGKKLTIKFKFSKTLNPILVPSIFLHNTSVFAWVKWNSMGLDNKL